MKMKRLVVIASVLFFLGAVVFFAPCRSYAFNPQPEPPGKSKSGIVTNESYKGTITKINGANITVRNDNGVEKIVISNMTGLKIGDKITVTGGKIIKAGGMIINPDLNPQPEPPMKTSPKLK